MNFAIVDLLVGPVAKLLEKVIPDLDERKRLAHEIATLAEKQAHGQMMAQLEVNKQEAAHKSLFVAGWRPFIGWVCGVSLAFNYVLIPLANASHTSISISPLDMTMMMPVLLGMLGLGTLRTAEKVRGVARER